MNSIYFYSEEEENNNYFVQDDLIAEFNDYIHETTIQEVKMSTNRTTNFMQMIIYTKVRV